MISELYSITIELLMEGSFIHLEDVKRRAAIHAALGEPARLAIVEALRLSDKSPSSLGDWLGIDSNLLAHHLDVLEEVGLIERIPSSGDRRRRYVRLTDHALEDLFPAAPLLVKAILFVCTHNSARHHWQRRCGIASQQCALKVREPIPRIRCTHWR